MRIHLKKQTQSLLESVHDGAGRRDLWHGTRLQGWYPESQGAICCFVLQIGIAFGSRISCNIFIARMKDRKA